jgi:glycogen operon protein
VEELRNRQVKNCLTATVLALGIPMLLMGDEVRRTQGGNNNAYCHDDESTWFDWSLLDKHADVHRFVTLLAARRLLRDVEHEHRRVTLTQMIADATKAWHGVKLGEPEGRAFPQHRVHCGTRTVDACPSHLNAYWGRLISVAGRGPWRRWIDASASSGHCGMAGGSYYFR